MHRCNLGVAPEQETILGFSGPGPKRLLAPSLIDFRGKNGNSGLVPGNRDPNQKRAEYCFGEENSLSLTEFWGKLGEFCDKLGEFAFTHKL